MKIVGGQFFSDFKDRVRITKELEKTYSNKVKIRCEDNFISYTAFTNNVLAR